MTGFYDDDPDDPWVESDPDAELDAFRLISAVAHAQLLRANKDNETALIDLIRIGEYIEMLEMRVEVLDSCLNLEGDMYD